MDGEERSHRFNAGAQGQSGAKIDVLVDDPGGQPVIQVFSLSRSRSFSGPDAFRDIQRRVVSCWRDTILAKAVFDLPTTRDLIERLEVDSKLRRPCGWSSVRAVPSEATFSRAFAEFALRSLPDRLHEALIKRAPGDHLVGHISRDATAIEARRRLAERRSLDLEL